MREQVLTYSIGGLVLQISGGADAVTASRLPGMEAFAVPPVAGTSLRINLDASLSLPDCRWLHRFDIADGQAECRFGIAAGGIYYYTFADKSVLRYDPHQQDTVDISTLAHPDILRFALWMAYAMLAVQHGAVPIHSSVVVCRDRAVLCLGESGTGKSTHTSLWMKHIEGCHLLNDDSPILRVEGDEVLAYGSPWSGKTPCYRQERVPVSALVRLEQRPDNTIWRLPTVEAFIALQPSCPPSMAHDEQCTDRVVAIIGDVLMRVPVYRLGCRPDADAARLCYNTVFLQS